MALYHRNHWHYITGMGGTMATGLSTNDMKFQRLQANMRINITDYGIFDREESERIYVKFEGKLNSDGTITMNQPYSYNFEENSREVYMLKRWKVNVDNSAIIV